MRRYLLCWLAPALLFLFSTAGFSQVLINEDFSTASGTTPPTGWSNNDLNSSGILWAFNNPGSRTFNAPITSPAAIFDSDDQGFSGGSEDATLETPTFNASTGNLYLSFDHFFYQDNANGTATVEVFNGTVWDTVLQYTSDSPDPEHVVVSITAEAGGSANAKVRFHWTGTWDYYWIIDNVRIEGLSCPPPAALGVTAITASTADAYWTTGGASSWELEYGLSGFVPGSGTVISASNDTTALPSLSPNTSYDFYVRDICGVGDESSWVGPFTFTTECAGITSLPYNETFNSTSSNAACWSVVDVNDDGDEWSVNTSSSYVQEGDRSYTIYTDFNGGNNDDYLISPAITLSGNERLSYWYRARSASEPNDFEVLISTTGDNPADFTTQLLRDTATSTTYAQEIIDLSSYSGQVYLAFHIPSGGLDGYYLYIDNITFEAIPSCLAPTALGAANITSSSADLYWTGGGASDWNVEYGITGFGQGSGTMVNTQNDTLNIPSLSSNTSYDFYVRDSCGLGDVSSWTGPYTFTTACGALLPPQNEDFSGGVPPACWDVADGGTPATGPTGLGSAEWENKGFGNTASSGAARINLFDNTIEDWLLSPEYDLTSGGPYQVEFDFGVFEFSFGTSGSATGTLGSDDQVQLLVSSDNGVTWTSLATFDNTYVTNTGGNHETIDLSVYSGNTVKFGIWASEGTTDDAEDMDVFVDNFQVRLIPTCADPTNPGATNITDVSADLYWTESGTATSWNVEYGVSGFTLGVGTSIVASNDTTSIGSLTPATTYDYYVQSDCGSGSQSTWVGPFTFATTLCPPSNQCSYNLKLHDSWGDGWNGTEVTVYQNNVAVAVIGPEFTDLTGSPLGDTLLTTLPLCDNVTTYFVITQGSNGTPNFSEEIGLDVSNLYGVLQFKHDNNAAADQGDTIGMMVTDCTPPACANPAGLGVTNISTNSATLYWKDLVGNANDWNLEYGPGGFAQGTGTTMIATNDTVTIGSLSPQTTYEFYVMANCGAGGTSSWVGPFAFTTTCAPLAIPQLEDFSNGFPPTICWDVADDGTPATGPLSLGTSTWTEDGFANNGTTGAVKINLFLNDKRDWILTPSYDLATGGPHQVEFDFGIFTWNTSTPAALGSDDEVQILVTTDEGATWTALAVYDNSYVTASGGNHVVIDLSAYSGDTVQFGIWGNDGTVDDGPDNDIMLDNFQVRTTPACPEPFGLGAMNVTSATADVYWTQLGSTSAWNIEYGPAGFTQGAGTITSASNDTSNVNGLTPQTSYDFYVQADCGTNGVSIWVGPFTFTTGCAALNTFPWVEDFETSQTTIPTCWINETNDNSDWLFITGSIGHGSTGDHTTGSGHYATVDDSQNSANDTVNNLLTPLFDLTSLTTPQLSFWYFIGKDASLTSKLVIDVFDGTSWNRGVATIRFGQRAWLSAFVDLTPYISTNTQIRFRGVETTDFNSDISIDDVVIQEAPMCPDPFALGAINFTSSSANVFWSQIGSVSNWNIEYGPINFMQGTGTIVNVSNDTVPVSGLSPNTSYDFYVQADCGMGTTSAWIGPFTFTTACAPLLPPQLEDFSAGFLPTACWDEADDGTPATGPLSLGASSWTEDGFANNGGTGAVKINLFFNDKSDWILTPSYDLAAGGPFQVEFDFGIFAWNTANPAALGSDDEVQILVTDDAGSTWTPLAVYDNTYITSAGGNHVVLDITAYSGDTVQFGIWASEGSVDDGPDNDVMMDNFEVRATPACPEPFALGSTGITSISANVYWTQMGSASSWNIEYGPAGFLQGTGTTSTVGNDTINITGLTAQTTYDFYVQTDCGTNGTSVWVGPFTFTTLCGPLLPPQLEDFSTGLPPTICWDQADGGTPATGPSGFGVSEWYESGFANVGSTGAVAINLFNLGTEDWLLSPQYDLATGGPFQVEFDLGIYEFLSSTPGTLGSDDEVQILITNDGGATWTAIRTFDDTYVTPGVAGNHEIICYCAVFRDMACKEHRSSMFLGPLHQPSCTFPHLSYSSW
ncbi:MAG: hypothetical protein CMI36_06950 [Owenweeksia sp.]|nr:hypothetical protein [Owenweeksia sp.]